MKKAYLGLLWLVIFLSFACSNRSRSTAITAVSSTGKNVTVQNSEGIPEYARGFTIREGEKYTELCIMDPWSRSDTFAVYRVTNAGQKRNSIKDDESVLPLNPKRWAVFSTTHVGFMDALGASDLIIGCTTPDRLYNEKLYHKYISGELIRIGSDMEYNFETLMVQKPDIIIQTGFAGQKAKDAMIRQSGIDIVYVMEWMEPTPLGRAEWIKVFGLLLNCESKADSVFENVKHSYSILKNKVMDIEHRPKVIIGNNFKGTWYMPGGGNYMSQFLEDAGYSYPWSDSKESGSLALGFETVVHEFTDAPLWLNVSAKELNDLKYEDSRYTLFKAFTEGDVYSLNNRVVRGMANDYWEGAVVHPELVLADLIYIAHPDLLNGHQLVYYKKLQ